LDFYLQIKQVRFLGIDHGSVRTGIAMSDELAMFASPLETVETPKAISRICEITQKHQIQSIVVGMPRNMDGTYGPKCDEVKAFIEKLKARCAIPIRTWDERLTTRSAERMLIEADVSRKKRKEIIDKIAAQQILQSFLDSQTNY
jgi:putative Holliday junction resolvase